MSTPLPGWGEPIAEAEIVFPDGTKAQLIIRASKPFRAWLESVEATLSDHETRIAALEP